jgi:hypothetical protein
MSELRMVLCSREGTMLVRPDSNVALESCCGTGDLERIEAMAELDNSTCRLHALLNKSVWVESPSPYAPRLDLIVSII